MTEDSLEFVRPHNEGTSKEVALDPIRLGGDELNLAEFPFALLADRQPDDVGTIEFSDVIRGKDSQRINRTWILTGSEEFGLPVASDEQMYVALMELTREQGFDNRVIYLTRYELIKRLGWPDKGGSYARVKGCLDRLLGVTITAKQAFWDKTKQRYVDVGFHIIDDYALYNEPVGRKRRYARQHQPLSYVAWNQVVFKSFQAGNIKQLDTSFYFGLRSAVSRRLFRYLDKKRLDGKPAFRIGLRKLGFEKLGMSRNYYPSHIKQELARAHRELIDNGFLERAEYLRSGRDADEQVYYWFSSSRYHLSMDTHQRARASSLFQQLSERGITPSVAEQLVAEYGDQVQAQTEAEDARQAAEAEQQRQERRQQQLEKRQARRSACRRALERLSPAERQEIEEAAQRHLQEDNPALAAHPQSTAYQVLLDEYIADLLIPSDE